MSQAPGERRSSHPLPHHAMRHLKPRWALAPENLELTCKFNHPTCSHNYWRDLTLHLFMVIMVESHDGSHVVAPRVGANDNECDGWNRHQASDANITDTFCLYSGFEFSLQKCLGRLYSPNNIYVASYRQMEPASVLSLVVYSS